MHAVNNDVKLPVLPHNRAGRHTLVIQHAAAAAVTVVHEWLYKKGTATQQVQAHVTHNQAPNWGEGSTAQAPCAHMPHTITTSHRPLPIKRQCSDQPCHCHQAINKTTWSPPCPYGRWAYLGVYAAAAVAQEAHRSSFLLASLKTPPELSPTDRSG